MPDATSIGQIGLDLVVNENGFKKQMSGIQSLAKKAAASLAAAFAVKKIVDFGKSCLELGSNLSEVQNVVDVTFPSMTSKVDEFAKAAATSFGLSEAMSKKFTGTFGAMAKAFGFSEQAAYDMGSVLTGLAGDVASFYNITQDEAYTKLKSVFTGETESLKDLGVVMTQSALDAYALANGFGKTTSAMSEAEKVALRYQFVQNQLAAAQGDFARTSGSWANQVRILKLQFDSLKATIGQGLINLFTPIIKVVNTLIGKLATLANAFKSFTELITGNKSSGTSQISGMGFAAADASIGMQNASDSADNMAKSANKAGNAAKKASNQMRALMGFDAINKLQEQTDDSTGDSESGSGTSTGGIGSAVDFGSLAQGETVIDKTDKKLSKIVKRFKELEKIFKKGFKIGFGDSEKKLMDIKNSINGIKESLFEIFADGEIEKAANGFLDSFSLNIGKISGSLSSIGITIAQNIIGGINKYLSNSKGYIKGKLVSLFDISSSIHEKTGDFMAAFSEVFSAFGGESGKKITASLIGIFSDAFLGIVELGAKYADDIIGIITGPFVDNQDEIRKTIDNTLSPVSTVLETIWKSVKNTVDKVMEVYDNSIHPLFISVRDGLSEIAGKFLEWYNGTIAPVLDRLAEKFTIVWQEHVQPVIDKAIELIGHVAQIVQALWENIIKPFIEWIIENILPVIGPILEAVGEFALDLFATMSDVTGGILDMLDGLIIFLTGVFSGDWEKAFSGLEEIGNGFHDAIKSVFDFISEKILNPFIKWLDDVFVHDWTKDFGSLGVILNKFFKGVKDIWDDTKRTFNGIIDFISGIFTGNWERAWQGLQDIFGGIFNGMIDLAKRPINSVIDMINGLVGNLNWLVGKIESAFSFSYDFKNPLTGTRHYGNYGLSLPRVPTIPHLAQGGFVERNTPRLAVIGDNKRYGEIVSPEDKLQEMANKAAQMAGMYAIGKEDLEAIINQAVMRIVSALSELGFYIDSERVSSALRMAAEQKDYRQNPVIAR